MRCSALDWDRTQKDYIECSPSTTVQMVRLIGMITVELPLCDNHRFMFMEELERFGGHLDTKKRVQVLNNPIKK